MLVAFVVLLFASPNLQDSDSLEKLPDVLKSHISTKDLNSKQAVMRFLVAEGKRLSLDFGDSPVVPIVGADHGYVALLRGDGADLLIQLSPGKVKRLASPSLDDEDTLFPTFAAKVGTRTWIAGSADYVSNAWQPALYCFGKKLEKQVLDRDDEFGWSQPKSLSISKGRVIARFEIYSYPNNLSASHATSDREAILTFEIRPNGKVKRSEADLKTSYNTLDDMAGQWQSRQYHTIRRFCASEKAYQEFRTAFKALKGEGHIKDCEEHVISLSGSTGTYEFVFSKKHPSVLLSARRTSKDPFPR